jgi:IS1 family transposase
MNKLTSERRGQILGMMVEGMSIRSICRLTGVSKNTVVKLLADAGQACLVFSDRAMHGLTSKRIQCDEIWSFVYAKAKNVPTEKKEQFGFGDVWTWTAIDADTKLVPVWRVGGRDAGTAHELMMDLASRLKGRIQLTTDGHKAYLSAVEDAFGRDIDYAMLVKIYGEATKEEQRRYSPAVCTGAEPQAITGKPDPEHISTSYVERQNLSMRMGMRRFTRLTNAFSKKVENHIYALAIYFLHYNFVRIHQTLRVTPAMAAGVSKTLWSIEDMVTMIEAWEAEKAKTEKAGKAPRKYRPRQPRISN